MKVGTVRPLDSVRYKPGEILDCGHAPSEPEASGASGGTGYGHDREGRSYCYDCSATRERTRMEETGRAILYLVPHKETNRWYVSDWPGRLRYNAFNVTHSKHGGGFGAQLTRAEFWGPDGKLWSAVNRGDNDIARCRRLKRQPSTKYGR